MMQETPEEANRRWRAKEEADRVAEKARKEEAKIVGIRLQDAIVGQYYRITALHSGDTEIYEYSGCKGSHDTVSYGVAVGAVAYFKDPVHGCYTLRTTSALEPGGSHAQWFMVPLTDAETAAAPAQFEKAKAEEKVRSEKEDKAYAAYVAALNPWER